MRSLTGLLPSSTAISRVSGSAWAMAAAALAFGTAAIDGAYPLFDDGKLRILLALTTAPLSALALWVALRVRTRAGAIAVSIGIAAVLAFVNTIPASFVLALTGGTFEALPTFLFFGIMFGVPTGLGYGVLLSFLTALVHPSGATPTLDGTDQAKLGASVWTTAIAGIGLVFGMQLKAPPEALAFTYAVILAGLVASVLIAARWRVRSKWVARVREGREPHLRVRAMAGDDPPHLVRIGEGSSVIEWIPTEQESVYRAAALGEPLAIIAERRHH